MAADNGVDASLFSFNSKGACPACGGRGSIVTELVFMDPVTTVCEACEGKRYSREALSYRYHGKNIVEILELSATDAYEFFKDNKKLRKALGAMLEVGLPYLSLGQPLSTLSGGERQRVYLAMALAQGTDLILLDEPTTYLDPGRQFELLDLIASLPGRGKTVVMVLHDLSHALRYSTQLLLLEQGRLVQRGTPEELYAGGQLDRVFGIRSRRAPDGSYYFLPPFA